MSLLTLFLIALLCIAYPILLLPIIAIATIIFVKINNDYKKCTYYKITKCSYLALRRNLGKYGEFLTYKKLKQMEEDGAKFLFNLYIPKEHGETTEIDVLMICSKGIFVFESKNYSGWIFGSEHQKNWYQTLSTGRGRSHKESFYNPIMQNRSHIKHLQAFLGTQVPTHSIIVFSDRCTLKNIDIQSCDVHVINRCNINQVVSYIYNHTLSTPLSDCAISEIYDKLYPCTQVDNLTKAQHIINIQIKTNEIPAPTSICTSVIPPAEEPTAPTQTDDSAETIVPEPAHTTPQHKCPRCNGNLILRTANKGANAGKQFYGCSNYPKCKYLQNITNDSI